MMKRLQRIGFLLAFVLVTTFVGVIWWKSLWLSIPASEGIGIHIVIANQTTQEIGPFVVGDELSSTTLLIPAVQPHSVAAIDFVTPEVWGENSIAMTDPHGKQYLVVGYFEYSVRGRVDIVVQCANAIGLSGRRREITSNYLSIEWRPWGIPDCELPLQ